MVSHIREFGIVLEHKPPVIVADRYKNSKGCEPVYDCTHLELLAKALAEANEELLIVAPTIRGDAAAMFIRSVEAVLNRGVKVTVVHSASDDRSIQTSPSSIDVEQQLRRLFARYAGASLRQIASKGTNERILICDAQFAVIGSWDWLSHSNQAACQKQEVMAEVQIRQDISTCHYEKTFIESIKRKIQVT